MKNSNDGRPDNVCSKCGYGYCICNLQKRYLITKPAKVKGLTDAEFKSL